MWFYVNPSNLLQGSVFRQTQRENSMVAETISSKMIDVMHHISPAQSFQYIYPQLKHFSEKFSTAFYVTSRAWKIWKDIRK